MYLAWGKVVEAFKISPSTSDRMKAILTTAALYTPLHTVVTIWRAWPSQHFAMDVRRWAGDEVDVSFASSFVCY